MFTLMLARNNHKYKPGYPWLFWLSIPTDAVIMYSIMWALSYLLTGTGLTFL